MRKIDKLIAHAQDEFDMLFKGQEMRRIALDALQDGITAYTTSNISKQKSVLSDWLNI